MLINLRDKNKKLVIKDMLDIDFDMMIEERDNKFYVVVNQQYKLDESFENEDEAEEEMIYLARVRNELEDELRKY